MARTNSMWRLNHPFTQNFIAGSILFCLPGIYLALTGLGAGGGKPSSQQVAANVNAILYAVFFLTGWFGGAIFNLIGPRWTVLLGSVGYAIYTGVWNSTETRRRLKFALFKAASGTTIAPANL